MRRTAFAMAAAGLIFAAVFGTAQAAPIVPLPAGVTADLSDVTQVSWRRCWRDRAACIAAAVGVIAGAAFVADDFTLHGAKVILAAQ
jgi:hypothetical protein